MLNSTNLEPKKEKIRKALYEEGVNHLKTAWKFRANNKLTAAISELQKAMSIFEGLESWNELITTKVTTGNVYRSIGEADKALLYLEKAMSLGKRFLEKKTLEMAGIYAALGILHVNVLRQIDTALQYFEEELSITEDLEDTLSIAKSCINIAKCHYLKGDYKKQLAYLTHGLKSVQVSKVYTVVVEGVLYHSLGGLYEKRGDFEKATTYYFKSLEMYENHYDPNQHNFQSKEELIVGTSCILGNSYLNQNKFEKADFYLQKAYKISMETWAEGHIKTNKVLNYLVELYEKQEEYEKALQYRLQAFEYYSNKGSGIGIAKSYTSLSRLYRGLKHYDLAKDSVLKAIELLLEQFRERRLELIAAYHALASIHYDQANYREALTCHHLIVQIYFRLDSTHQLEDIPTLDINSYFPTPQMLSSIGELANACYLCYFNENRGKKTLRISWGYIQLLLSLSDQVRKHFYTEGSKLLLSNNLHQFYSIGIQVALSLENQQESAFQLAEKSKASTIFAAIKDDFAKTLVGIPTKVLEEEQQLKIELTYLKKSIEGEEIKTAKKDEKILQRYRSQYFDYLQSYTQLIEKIEQDYPDYYQLKYETQTASIDEIQESLTENQVMVSYFVGETHYYIFLITPNLFEMLDYEKPGDFEELIDTFLQAIQQHQLKDYYQTAFRLHRLLMKEVEAFLIDPFAENNILGEGESISIGKKQLIIAPHGILNYLPFEALLCSDSTSIIEDLPPNENPYHHLDYLLLHCEISYHYSTTLWHYLLTTRREKTPINDDFVGFAPVYQSDTQIVFEDVAKEVSQWATRSEALQKEDTWIPLPHSKTEAENIAALFAAEGLESQTFLHEEATKEQFQEAAEKSRFLLVAAHGVVNDEHPKLSGLVFHPKNREEGSGKRDVEETPFNLASRLSRPISQTDCILSMEETYHLNLQADLVVLSSCESGIGQLAKGEGMMAVNRGFLYAGAKNVVSTLFKVYDRPSSLLTQYLFEEILKNPSKYGDYSAALRRAKLRLLQMEKVDPKSWCGFVLIGQ